MTDYKPGVSVPCTCNNCSNPDEYVAIKLDRLSALINELVPPDPDFWKTCIFVPGLEDIVWGHTGRDYVKAKRDTIPTEFYGTLGL